MNKFDRVFSILILLQTKRVTKAADIAEKFDVSQRTIYRDIRTLKNAGIPILGDPGIGYSVMEGYRIPPMMFNEEEVSALLAAEKFIGKFTDKNLEQNYLNAMLKIKAILRSNEKQSLEILEDSIAITASYNRGNANNFLQTLLKSVASKNIIEIQYQNGNGAISERKIETIGCYYQSNMWYLVAFCQVKKDYRTFKVNQIKKLRASQEYHTNEHIGLQDYINKQTKEWRDKQDFHSIEIAFKPSLVHFAKKSKYYFGFVEETTKGDATYMTFLNSSIELMARWLLQYGDQVTIIKPVTLKKRLGVLAAQLNQHYNS